MGVRTVMVRWNLHFTNVLLAAVNPGTYIIFMHCSFGEAVDYPQKIV